MNWSFSIATPFPGSELYNICFKKTIFKSHYDFFNRFNEDTTIGGLTVNLTQMTDEEVLNWQQKLKLVWKIEKRRAVGQRVAKIENLRIKAHRFNDRLNKKIFKKLPKNIIGIFLKRIYDFFYDLMQILFDKVRLYLLGVRKY